ncbi:glycosyltransferase family 9 protein [Brumimicrobium aurantiacum]|uniref:Glycosyltransferase family 9 protein n=1 Tax=Brumimicrobium aurantiacum TaxID=1737063 RepID=A0A3E1F241_9FLAO|nr:glycosyltransferase family 9 protein [Brumimicrobium aurantiacum]RFC55894.1 glycosyltransferase family 9 protein [Brumimicrobium aurantiacum]
MKTKHQLAIDNYLIKPIAFLMNFLVRIVGKILSIDHNLNRDFKKIAVCKFKGMGSIIQATPMLEALRKQFPDAEIIFVSTKANATVLKKIDSIDTVVCLNDKGIFKLISTTLSALYQLVKKRPDVYIDLEIYSNFSTLFTLFTFSKNRIGFYLRSSSFNMGIYTHMMFFNNNVPISEVYLQISRLFGTNHTKNKLFPLHKNTPKYNAIPDQKYIIVNPNASDLRLERRWGADKFKALIKQLVVAYPSMQILVVGSKDERPYSTKTVEGINHPNVKNIAGKTSIDELISLIHHATLVITNDTGPMHIAFACETPTVCLFGPCSPDQYGGNAYTTVIYKKVFCSPCVHDFNISPCNGDNVCMKLISVDEVFNSAKNHLDDQFEPKLMHQQQTIYYSDKGQKTLGLVRRTL